MPRNNRTYYRIPFAERLAIIERSCKQVSRGVFFSTVIIITSFLPVFLLTGQEGKLFHPLAYTKTFILVVDAFLVVTLAPVLISFFMRGRFRGEQANPINRLLEKVYEPLIRWCIRWRKTTIGLNILALVISIPLILSLGREFMPPTRRRLFFAVHARHPPRRLQFAEEVKRILQVQDKICIKSDPEVLNVLGKAGRANTATDNSPISMIETIVLLKPKRTVASRHHQRKTSSTNSTVNCKFPASPTAGPSPSSTASTCSPPAYVPMSALRSTAKILILSMPLRKRSRTELQGVDGVKDLYVEPITGGKYIDISIKRDEIARYGLSVDDVNTVIESAVGGIQLTTTIEGRRRFSVNARYAQDFRDNITALQRGNCLYKPPMERSHPLSAVADIRITEGPAMINSENALLRGTVLFNVRDRDLAGTVQESQGRLNKMLTHLPKGYFLEWSGQYENLISGEKTLRQADLPYRIARDIYLYVLRPQLRP